MVISFRQASYHNIYHVIHISYHNIYHINHISYLKHIIKRIISFHKHSIHFKHMACAEQQGTCHHTNSISNHVDSKITYLISLRYCH